MFIACNFEFKLDIIFSFTNVIDNAVNDKAFNADINIEQYYACKCSLYIHCVSKTCDCAFLTTGNTFCATCISLCPTTNTKSKPVRMYKQIAYCR